MKVLKNNVDNEAKFTDLEEAKKWYKPDLNEFPECEQYAQEIEGAETLEELEAVLNKYTDKYGDGRIHEVVEV